MISYQFCKGRPAWQEAIGVLRAVVLNRWRPVNRATRKPEKKVKLFRV